MTFETEYKERVLKVFMSERRHRGHFQPVSSYGSLICWMHSARVAFSVMTTFRLYLSVVSGLIPSLTVAYRFFTSKGPESVNLAMISVPDTGNLISYYQSNIYTISPFVCYDTMNILKGRSLPLRNRSK